MSLKQKILEIKSAYSYQVDLVRRDMILHLLDEATKQIQESLDKLIAEFPSQNYVFCPYCKGGCSTYSSNEQLHWLKQLREVLSVLDGEKKAKA